MGNASINLPYSKDTPVTTTYPIITLTQDEVATLTCASQSHANIDTRIKAEGLLHLFETQDISYTAIQMFVDDSTLNTWLSAWQEKGLEGIAYGDVPTGPDTVYSDLALKHYLADAIEDYPGRYWVDADE